MTACPSRAVRIAVFLGRLTRVAVVVGIFFVWRHYIVRALTSHVFRGLGADWAFLSIILPAGATLLSVLLLLAVREIILWIVEPLL